MMMKVTLLYGSIFFALSCMLIYVQYVWLIWYKDGDTAESTCYVFHGMKINLVTRIIIAIYSIWGGMHKINGFIMTPPETVRAESFNLVLFIYFLWVTSMSGKVLETFR